MSLFILDIYVNWRVHISISSEEEDKPKYLQGTRIDLLQWIYDWVYALDISNVLLITGAAGTREGTVARMVCKKLERRNQVGVWEGEDKYVGCTGAVSWAFAYNLARSSFVIAERMQSAIEGDSGSSFPLMNIMLDELFVYTSSGGGKYVYSRAYHHHTRHIR